MTKSCRLPSYQAVLRENESGRERERKRRIIENQVYGGENEPRLFASVLCHACFRLA